MNGIRELGRLGQSVWYDNIDRTLLISGEIAALIAKGITCITSNPTIFEKAIVGSTAYDKSIKQSQTTDVESLFEELAIEDIKRASELLLPVYERTHARDGYVSVEVSPRLARDRDGTVEQATRLFQKIGASNVMIKVPATEEGILAFEQLIAEGMNVNVTLIFGLSTYEQVLKAYLRGLTTRLDQGKGIRNIGSVASFFVSRVDQRIDSLLNNKGQFRHLRGKAAIANCKLAYKLFTQKFLSSEFQRLAENGGQIQRILWASTGRKNMDYPELMYVSELVGENSINTMPPATLKAVEKWDNFETTASIHIDDAERTVELLNHARISLERVSADLLGEGLGSFMNSFESILDVLSIKRSTLSMET